MKTRTLLFVVLAFPAISSPAQEVPPAQIANWPAPSFWQPAARALDESKTSTRGQIGAESALALPTPPVPFVAVTPCRIVDTRFSGGAFAAGETRTYAMSGGSLPCVSGFPADLAAVSLNVTVTQTTGTGFLTGYPSGGALPTVSTVNWIGVNQTVSNSAVVPTQGGASSSISVFASQATHVILDINGYYAGGVVTSVNSLTGPVTLAAGSNVTITPSGQTLTLSASSGPGGVLPTATSGQTLRHNGTAWVANSALTSDGTDVAITGTLVLPSTPRLSAGGTLFLHIPGVINTFLGEAAGNPSSTGGYNTGIGYGSLTVNTSGVQNTGVGYRAVGFNTSGNNNTGVGHFALENNGTGDANTAIGSEAFRYNLSGSFNTATGYQALNNNNTAGSNTATGYQAMLSNTSGGGNTAAGYQSLYTNTVGAGNVAVGMNALMNNTQGHHNTASGTNALLSNTTGDYNTVVGHDAFRNNVSGVLNIAIGDGAGNNITTGSSNILIGNAGFANESNTIRIGDPSFQSAAIIAGIAGATAPSGSAVLISAGGRLGTVTSSRRYKEDIRDIAQASEGLLRLRPVAFRYKPELDPDGVPQYGLIAEEVADVYPELVVKGRDGQPETVRYHLLVPMLLNEFQKQHQIVEAQEKTIERQNGTIQTLAAKVAKLEARLAEPR